MSNVIFLQYSFVNIYLINCFTKLIDLSIKVTDVAGTTHRLVRYKHLKFHLEGISVRQSHVVCPVICNSVIFINPDLQINIYLVHKIVNIVLSISLNICFGCSKEPSI